MQDDTWAVEVTQNDVLRFLGTAFRNIYLPRLSTDDLREIQRGLADEIARALPVPSEPEEPTEAMVLGWLTHCDNLIVVNAPSGQWQVRRASSSEVRGEGDTPFVALQAAMRAARPTASRSGGE